MTLQKSSKPIISILKLAQPHWPWLVLGTLSLFIGSGIGLIYPQIARLTIDDVLAGKGVMGMDMTTLGFALLAMFGVQSFFVSLRYYLFTVIGDRIVTDLRASLYQAILRQDMAFFDEQRTGELTSRLASDTQVLQNAVTANLSMVLRYGTQAVGGLALLFYTSWRLALVLVVVLPLVFGVAIFYGRIVRRLSRAVQDAIAESTSVAEESLAGIRTVRSFAREAHEVERYRDAVEHSFSLAKKRSKYGAFFGGGMSYLSYGALAFVLWLGSAMVMDKTLSAGDLTAFLIYMFMVAFAVGVLSGLYTDFMKAIGASERVFGLLEREPNIRVSTEPQINTAPKQGEIVFDDVSFAYPTRLERPALDDVSLVISPGETVALVGHSGAGKSTVAHILSRFYDPQRGQILIDGHPLESFEPDTLREHIGMVAQEPLLFSGTIASNVQYGRLDASEEEVIRALKAARAWEFVSQFPDGINTLIGERGVRLSGGQKQRVAIARAILKDPVILVLDEATSALDVESEALVQQALETLMQDRTTVIIAHRLSTVQNANKIVVLEQGRVVEIGDHHTLLEKDGHYAQLIAGQRV